jgi:hypothetical protein
LFEQRTSNMNEHVTSTPASDSVQTSATAIHKPHLHCNKYLHCRSSTNPSHHRLPKLDANQHTLPPHRYSYETNVNLLNITFIYHPSRGDPIPTRHRNTL